MYVHIYVLPEEKREGILWHLYSEEEIKFVPLKKEQTRGNDFSQEEVTLLVKYFSSVGGGGPSFSRFALLSDANIYSAKRTSLSRPFPP